MRTKKIQKESRMMGVFLLTKQEQETSWNDGDKKNRFFVCLSQNKIRKKNA